MGRLKIFKHKKDALATINATADLVRVAFREREKSDASRRQLNAISSGYESASALVDQTRQLQIAKLLRGKGISPSLIERLHAIDFGDLVQSTSGRRVNIGRLLLKFCLDEEVESLNNHRDRIVDAGKALQELLLLQMNSLLEHLLTRTDVEDTEAKEFYRETELEDLTDCIVTLDAQSVGEGAFATVFKTDLVRNHVSRKVAVKVLRVYQFHIDDPMKKRRVERRLRREIRVWKDLHHINVVPLLGLVHGFKSGYSNSPFPSMVCPWMGGGPLTKYLIARREDLTLKERLQLLADVIDGLSYLHSQSVIHGDLTSANVLISENTACLSDFGLSQVVSEFADTSYMTYKVGGAVRWAAPELYPEDDNDSPLQITKFCDIYAYGCIMHEVISGHLPYFDISTDALVMVHKMMRTPAARPAGPLLTNELWEFIQLCCRMIPEWRPEATQVTRKLQDIRSGYSNEALAMTLPPIVEEAGLELD